MYIQLLNSHYVQPILNKENQIKFATQLVLAIRSLVYFVYVIVNAGLELLNKVVEQAELNNDEPTQEVEAAKVESINFDEFKATNSTVKTKCYAYANSVEDDTIADLSDIYLTDLEDYLPDLTVEYLTDLEDYSDEDEDKDEEIYDNCEEFLTNLQDYREEERQPSSISELNKQREVECLMSWVRNLWKDYTNLDLWGLFTDEEAQQHYKVFIDLERSKQDSATNLLREEYSKQYECDCEFDFDNLFPNRSQYDDQWLVQYDRLSDRDLNSFFYCGKFYLHPALTPLLEYEWSKPIESYFTYPELKAEHKRLVKQYHPDTSGSTQDQAALFNKRWGKLLLIAEYKHLSETPPSYYPYCDIKQN